MTVFVHLFDSACFYTIALLMILIYKELSGLIGASLSEPHIDGTAGRFHICIIIIIIIIVRPSPARRAWSHEVCRASHSHTWLP